MVVQARTTPAEALEEKMPESAWHSERVDFLKALLQEALSGLPQAVVLRDVFFEFQGQRYAPDLAVILEGAPPLERIGMIYRVPEDGPAPDAVVEVAVSAPSLGENLGEKADFYGEMGVRDYLVVQTFPGKPARLWWCALHRGERPKSTEEAVLESLGLTVRAEGRRLRVFHREGQEVLPPHEALAQERARREELERQVAELERRLQEDRP